MISLTPQMKNIIKFYSMQNKTFMYHGIVQYLLKYVLLF